MGVFQHFVAYSKNLYRKDIFVLTKYRVDGPERRTEDSTTYLLRGLTIIGFLAPTKHVAIFYGWSIFINTLVTFCMPFGFFISFVTRISDFSPTEFISSLQLFANCFGCAAKLTLYFFLYKKLLVAIKYMKRLDARISDPEDKQLIKKNVAFCNWSHMMYTTLFLLNTLSNFVAAIYNKKPAYQIYNPFMNWEKASIYLYSQIGIEFFLISFHCYQQAVLDSYPVIYISIIRTHLDILARRISKLGQNPKLNSDERYEALKQCVIDHKNIMSIYNEFAPVLSKTIFVQFIVIGITLGITTINIVLFADFTGTIISIIYGTSILTETFPCSFLANCLMDDIDSIPAAIFHSNWPDEEPRYKQVISYFIQNTQKTLVLTAMKIFPITMNSNINVVKFAFSIYTLIREVDVGLNNIEGAGKE